MRIGPVLEQYPSRWNPALNYRLMRSALPNKQGFPGSAIFAILFVIFETTAYQCFGMCSFVSFIVFQTWKDVTIIRKEQSVKACTYLHFNLIIMRFLHLPLALLGLICLFPYFLLATTIVPYANLGEATANSESVVLARAISHVESADGSNIYKETRFEVLETVKGTLVPSQLFQVRPMSHRSGEYDIDIAGDFEPTMGKEYLLFLRKKGDTWTPVMLSYYVFEQIVIGTDEFLAPVGGHGIEVAAAPGMPKSEPLAVYQTDLLLQNLLQYSLAPNTVWDGSIGRTGLHTNDIQVLDRTVPTGCDFMLGNSSVLARWQNAAIPIYYDDTNVPAGWDSYFASILGAMTSNYTGIAPSNAGPTSYVPTCTGGAGGGNFLSYCNANLGGPQCALIIFDDPCNEIAPLVNCGGVLAFGGSYSSSNTHTFDGVAWQNASYGYLVVNDGVPTCWPGSDFEQMLTHELTHVYRMDHLDAGNYPNQNMNPFCCQAINTKDIECMNYAYPGSLPVELSAFEARLLGKEKVELTWVTQTEKDNAHFTIQRSADGLQFEKMVEMPGTNTTTGGTYAWTDEHPQPCVNYYLLSQTDFDGSMVHLGIKSVDVTSSKPVLRIIPNPVEAETLRMRVDLPAAFDGFMQVLDKDGRIISSTSLSMEQGSTWVQQPLNGLLSGVYTIRLYDARQQFCARFTKK